VSAAPGHTAKATGRPDHCARRPPVRGPPATRRVAFGSAPAADVRSQARPKARARSAHPHHTHTDTDTLIHI